MSQRYVHLCLGPQCMRDVATKGKRLCRSCAAKRRAPRRRPSLFWQWVKLAVGWR